MIAIDHIVFLGNLGSDLRVVMGSGVDMKSQSAPRVSFPTSVSTSLKDN